MGRTLKQLGWKRMLGAALAISAAGLIASSSAAQAAGAPQRSQMDAGTNGTEPMPAMDAGTMEVVDAGVPEMGSYRRPQGSKNVPES